jgi:hypothetical protein
MSYSPRNCYAGAATAAQDAMHVIVFCAVLCYAMLRKAEKGRAMKYKINPALAEILAEDLHMSVQEFVRASGIPSSTIYGSIAPAEGWRKGYVFPRTALRVAEQFQRLVNEQRASGEAEGMTLEEARERILITEENKNDN